MIFLISGLLVGAYITYTHIRISALQKKLEDIPTTKEIAKEILTMRLPVDDLPEDVKAIIAEEFAKKPSGKKDSRGDYFG